MNMKEIGPQLFVAAQISPAEIGVAAAAGIRVIINNRPDNETPDQPDTNDMAAAASAAGIEFLHIPVVAGAISDDSIEGFANAYRNADGPVLAYCRSGMRSTSLWALAEAESMDISEIMSTAQNAGYDLEALRPRLESRAPSAAKPT